MKLLFQQLCSQNVDWDEEVTGAHRKTWDKWLKDLKSAAYVEIDRNIFKERKESEGKLECSLHGFCDASKHSNLLKLLRVIALVVRFTRNVRAKQRGGE